MSLNLSLCTLIEKAHTYSDAFLFANKLEKENFLVEGLDMESNLAYAYTVFHMVDTAAYRYNWDGTTYPAVSEYGGEIGKWASNARNEKHTITHKLHLNYVINNNHSVNFNSLFSYASGHPKDDLKDKVVGYKTNFKSTMMSWIAGIGYDFRTNNDIFLNSLNVKYYTYGMNTHMSSIMSSEAEKVDMLKRDFGISNALRYRFTPDFMGKFSVGYDVRLPAESEQILRTQRARIDDPDRLRQFDFISRSVISDTARLDTLFNSLLVAENRRIEPWTAAVIRYLNHPLREEQSVKYIRPGLEVLEEVQRTGDIFFPKNWASALLGNHLSRPAYEEVVRFLDVHPDYSPLLKNKILQAAYSLYREND